MKRTKMGYDMNLGATYCSTNLALEEVAAFVEREVRNVLCIGIALLAVALSAVVFSF
jgi:hypothetical protein